MDTLNLNSISNHRMTKTILSRDRELISHKDIFLSLVIIILLYIGCLFSNSSTIDFRIVKNIKFIFVTFIHI